VRVLISTWSLQVGGGEILALNLAAELHRRGHVVFVFNQRAHLIDRDVVARLLPAGVQVLSMADQPQRSYWAYKVNAMQQRLGRQPTFFLSQQRRYLASCIRRYGIEVLHSHATFSDELCAPVAASTDTPLVITEHGEYNQFLLEGRHDFAGPLLQAQRIVTVSEYCRRNLMAAFTDLPPMQTVYNGVVVNQGYTAAGMREQLGIPAEAFVFGMVARGVEKKGWRYAIEAFQKVREQPASRPLRLVLVGGSDFLQKLRAEYAHESAILFTGQVPNPDFYLAGFDVGLLPTYFQAEALPLAVIEYIVAGKPTIASKVGGVPELLNPMPGPTGQLIDLDANYRPVAAELAAAMQRYVMEADLYALHATHARQVRSEFTMSACAAQYEQVYQQAIAQQATIHQA
jgi:glycosyltransferase involved in cell wall biosynthesis